MELRRQNWDAARRARGVIKEAYKEFNAVFGERYSSPYFTEFMTDDADTVLIGLGTVCAPGRTACKRLREKGHKVGFVSLRWFRPFPTIELRESLKRFKAVGVIDRDFAHGSPDDGGILLHEVRSALYPLKNRPAITNVITGLGGRDVSIEDCARMYEIAQRSKTEDKLDNCVTWMHTQLGAGGSFAIGMAAGLRALKRKGKIKDEPINAIAFCGDLGGGDMGLSGISGALQTDYDLLIIMYDNESAANTDIQATGLSTYGAQTTFTPPGSKHRIMQKRWKKNVAGMLAVGHPTCKYVATACATFPPLDYMNKVKKALAVGGPTFIHTYDPCPKGWDFHPRYSP